MLRPNDQICYVSNINAVFLSYRTAKCDTFLKKTFNLEQHITTSTKNLKNVYPENVHHTHETLFDKLDPFGNEYTDEQTLFKNLAILDFESVCVQEASFKSTDTTKRTGKKLLTLVAISPNIEKVC